MGRFTKILRSRGMKQLASKKGIKKQVYRRSKEIFNQRKREMLESFENHPVTKEIQGGPEAMNISNTIMGPGNLYSFIGFEEGASPTEEIYNLLNMGTRLSGNPRVVKKTKDRIYYGVRINTPTEGQLASASKMPWEPGSWLFKIEKGMSGLGYYIYEKYIKGSRSGTGMQIDDRVRTGVFKRRKYMSAILKTFKRSFIVK